MLITSAETKMAETQFIESMFAQTMVAEAGIWEVILNLQQNGKEQTRKQVSTSSWGFVGIVVIFLNLFA